MFRKFSRVFLIIIVAVVSLTFILSSVLQSSRINSSQAKPQTITVPAQQLPNNTNTSISVGPMEQVR